MDRFWKPREDRTSEAGEGLDTGVRESRAEVAASPGLAAALAPAVSPLLLWAPPQQ